MMILTWSKTMSFGLCLATLSLAQELLHRRSEMQYGRCRPMSTYILWFCESSKFCCAHFIGSQWPSFAKKNHVALLNLQWHRFLGYFALNATQVPKSIFRKIYKPESVCTFILQLFFENHLRVLLDWSTRVPAFRESVYLWHFKYVIKKRVGGHTPYMRH
jgi:hypothetical protein